MLNNIKYILIVCLCFVAYSVTAQNKSADDYFNTAAKAFVDDDKTVAAKTTLEGLNQFPNDIALNELAKILLQKNEEEQEQEQEQQEKNEEQKQEEEQNKEEQEQEQEKNQNQGEEEQNSGEQEEEENSEEEEQTSDTEEENDEESDEEKSEDEMSQGKEGDENEEGEEKEMMMLKLSKEDAERMLDNLEKEEKGVQAKILKDKAKQNNRNKKKIEKDW